SIVYPSNIAPYSDESESEQMLQILQSKDIQDSIINKYDLSAHYGIDSSYKYHASTMNYLYSQNVKISKTPYEGIIIEVMDKDPLMAYNMVESILDFYNKKIRFLHEEKFHEVVKMYERGLTKKRAYLDSLINRLYVLSTEYGLIDYEVQAEQISKGFLRTIDGTGSNNVNTREVLKLKSNIEQKGGELILLVELIEIEAGSYALLKADYEKAYMDFDRKFSYINVVTNAEPADKKSYPVRWMIVVISVLGSFFLALIVILILENYKKMSKTDRSNP
ncbi:MAG: hypothetical protein K8R53_02185, partial [Bacteroidales bacterium]|nr:hypothetical protein [Bacteroidales bacterium]